MKLLLSRLIILSSLLIFPLINYCQEKPRVVEKFASPNEPVKLTTLRINDKEFTYDEPVKAGKSWLKDLSLDIKNTSKKNIVFMRIYLEIPPLGKMDIPLALQLIYGHIPEKTDQAELPVETLAPGDTVTLSLTQKSYDFLQRFMAENQITSIGKVKLFFEFILFDDGVAWSKGVKMLRNPKNPNRWDVVDKWPDEDGWLHPLYPATGKIIDLNSLLAMSDKSYVSPVDTGFFFGRNNSNTHRNPPDVGETCIYFTSSGSITCSETYLCQANIYCIAPEDYGTRNGAGTYANKGSFLSRRVECSTSSNCNCLVEHTMVNNWYPNPYCTDRPCPPGAAGRCQMRGGEWDFETCTCSGGCESGCSPILIDTAGNGFALTNAANGVSFDVNGDGNDESIGWTAADSDDAFLSLDRNGNHRIDNGKELFGNFTSQPDSPDPNGFIALAEYDKPEKGGHNDGVINRQDAVFNRLRLWQDRNHNGFCDTNELFSLTNLEVFQLDLDYSESRRTDQYGNQFKYKARVWDAQHLRMGRWAWDVFFTSRP